MAEPLIPELGQVPFPSHALKALTWDGNELRSPSQTSSVWTYGELEASCNPHWGASGQTNHMTPQHLRECSCGIYAVFDVGDAVHYSYTNGGVLVGIEGSGVVVESDRGFRCTHARVSHVILPGTFVTEAYRYYRNVQPTTETAEHVASMFGLPLITLGEFLSETGISEWKWRRELGDKLEQLPRLWHEAITLKMRDMARDLESAAYRALKTEYNVTLKHMLGKEGGRRVRKNIG